MLKNQLQSFDERRDLFIASDPAGALAFATQHWIHTAERAIQQHGRFVVALSGGSTPAAIYKALAKETTLDWSKVHLFWSDERATPPDHPDSNYRMAMESFAQVPIPPAQIFRMRAESDIERHAADYEDKIRRLGKAPFDLIMLGVGEDGHTASLFPNTPALAIQDKLVAANHIPQLNTWRMTFTFPCINQGANIVFYALGAPKQLIVPQVLNAAIVSPFPASRIGTPDHKALWVLDPLSASNL